jgi:acyl carrier protein
MLEKLQEIVRRYTDDEGIVITSDMVLLTDLGLNSYELVQLVCEVEEEFSVEIPDRAIGSFKTVQDVIDYIAVNGY